MLRSGSSTMHDKLVARLNAYICFEKGLRRLPSRVLTAQKACTEAQTLLTFDVAALCRPKAGRLELVAASNTSSVDHDSHWLSALASPVLGVLQGGVETGGCVAEDGRQIQVCLLQTGDVMLFIRGEAFRPHEVTLAEEIAGVTGQALAAVRGRSRLRLRDRIQGRKRLGAVAAAVLFLCLPVTQSMLAPATISPVEPRMVTPAIAGIIEKIDVQPGQKVKAGDLLFTLDARSIQSEIDKKQQQLAQSAEKLRMIRQNSFFANEGDVRLAQAQAEYELVQLDLAFLRDQMERTEIRALEDGTVVYSDPADWLGRKVEPGQRVMDIVDPTKRQLTIWLPTRDAIQVDQKSSVRFFAESAPLSSIHGTLYYQSLLATETDGRPLSYRLLAKIDQDRPELSINAEGHARVYGSLTLMAYYLLRKPIAGLRNRIGL